MVGKDQGLDMGGLNMTTGVTILGGCGIDITIDTNKTVPVEKQTENMYEWLIDLDQRVRFLEKKANIFTKIRMWFQ